MEKGKVFAYVGTWPVLLRSSIPGFQLPDNIDADVKTGIFGFCLDPKTGDWLPTSNYYTTYMTSELCLSSDGKFLYSNDEDRNRNGVMNAGGSILSFAVNRENGELTFLNEQSSMGTNPTCVETDAAGRYAFLANLGNPHEEFAKVIQTADGDFKIITMKEEGTVAMFHILKDGSLTPAIDVAGFHDAYPEEQHERSSHHHCVKVDPSNKFLLACDMCDKIHVFRIDHKNGKLVPAERPFFETRTEVDPRTLIFHPTRPWFFVNNQNNSTVYTFSFDNSSGKIEELDYVSSVFNEEDSTKIWTSGMAISNNGRYLYVSNRTLQKRMPDVICPPNTVTIFQIDQETGKLTLKAVTAIAADNPRGITLAPDSDYLYITSMDTNEIFRYSVDPDDGMLSNPAVVANVPFPSSIKFLSVE